MPATNYQHHHWVGIYKPCIPPKIHITTLTAHLLWPPLLRQSLSSLESGIRCCLLGMWNTRSLAHELSIFYGSPDEFLQNECGCWTNPRCCRHKRRWPRRHWWCWLHSQSPSPTGMSSLASPPCSPRTPTVFSVSAWPWFVEWAYPWIPIPKIKL